MKMEEGKLFWTFMAPHLGYWIAAPMPSIKGMYCMIGSSFPNQQNIYVTIKNSLKLQTLKRTSVYCITL